MNRSLIYIYVLLGFLLGVLVGIMIVYKVEVNTLNQAFDSLKYCYEELIKEAGK